MVNKSNQSVSSLDLGHAWMNFSTNYILHKLKLAYAWVNL